ncbi:MAG: CDGSH iron-sulfur domain-containing protein [Alphaproteobacteria bacterium]|nr:CDGSH iron-sulfur domain-containing protein [Alphaproteobacteria bacterium]
MPRSYEGQEITVSFEPKKCIHSRKCAQNAPDIFNVKADGDWIQPDNGDVHQSINVANLCPSGAITYKLKNQASNPDIKVNTLHMWENGPLALRGNLDITDQQASQNATLCRCGLSRKKPFCDGAHLKGDFQATGDANSIESEPLEQTGGQVHIKPLKDGPLYVTGNLEICAGSGRLIKHTTKTALCRCGKSNNKPFCDGAHKATGFSAEGA